MKLNNTAFFGACFAAALASATIAVISPSCSATTRQALECQLYAIRHLPQDPDELTVGDLRQTLEEIRACGLPEPVPPDAGAP